MNLLVLSCTHKNSSNLAAHGKKSYSFETLVNNQARRIASSCFPYELTSIIIG